MMVGQSMAIVRYCAQAAGLSGEGKNWVISEMMLEEHNDVMDCFVQAKYKHAQPDSKEAWDTCLNEALPKHFAMLESKVSASGFFGSKLCAGDIAICSAVDFAADNDFDMKPYPKLKALYESVCRGEGVCAPYFASPPKVHFKRP